MTTLSSLTALGLCCALGNSKAEVWRNAMAGSQAGMRQRTDLLAAGQSVIVGEVRAALPDHSAWPKPYRTRNNQLAALAFSQIADDVAALRSLGPSPVHRRSFWDKPAVASAPNCWRSWPRCRSTCW